MDLKQIFLLRLVLLLLSCLRLQSTLSNLCANQSHLLPVKIFDQHGKIRFSPCSIDQSFLIDQQSIYQFDRVRFRWKQLCIRAEIVHQQVTAYSRETKEKRQMPRFLASMISHQLKIDPSLWSMELSIGLIISIDLHWRSISSRKWHHFPVQCDEHH